MIKYFFLAIVVARAFTSSQSAAAHRILFARIFAIAEADTGQSVRFRHIHGDGFDIVMADGHKGQALGMSFFLSPNFTYLSVIYRTRSLLPRSLCRNGWIL